ncbi:opsin, ultraviolet-sensitive-like [Chrysoperla carnea]|uniref:opsin, ultraviolet-sensitive-like n=1 Tax=Chrysoperla carnea TaxID=189513 RepID=UPI001D060022|nr:opsin, ultraviolet-sensitive-like [Chrysoperla carnea]
MTPSAKVLLPPQRSVGNCRLPSTNIVVEYLVSFVFIRCRSLRTPANTLIINLAISDFLMMSKTPIFIYNSLYFGPALGSIGCELYGYIGGLTGTVSIVTLTAISIDRYLVIVYPMDPNKRFTGFKSKLCIITTWVYGVIFSTLPLLNVGVGNYVPEGLLTSCSFDYLSNDHMVKMFILIFFCAAWVLPFCVICFCYSRILFVVIEAQKLTRTGATGSVSSRHCKDEEKRRTEIKLAGVVVVVILLWFLAWTPYAIVALLGISGYQHLITPITSMVPALFCKIASCVDPFIYAVTHPRFRSEIKNMFGRGSKHQRRGTARQQSQQYSISISSESGLAEKPPPPPPVPPLQVPQEIRNDSLRSNQSGNIEEIMVLVNIPTTNKFSSQTFSNSGHSTSLNMSSADCLQNASRPPSWYKKPSFATRSTKSSIKSIRGRLSSVKRDPST